MPEIGHDVDDAEEPGGHRHWPCRQVRCRSRRRSGSRRTADWALSNPDEFALLYNSPTLGVRRSEQHREIAGLAWVETRKKPTHPRVA